MKKILYIFTGGVFLFLCHLSLVCGQGTETITITTYYPSPYGSFNELSITRKMDLGVTSEGYPGVGDGNYGAKIYFSGAPDVSGGSDNSNSDPLWISRYNVSDDVTQLRVNVGNDQANNDKFVVGTTDGSGLWHPRLKVAMGPRLALDSETDLSLYGESSPTVFSIHGTSGGGWGTAKIEFWSDPLAGGNYWRPASIQSIDNGGYTGGLAFITNGTGSANKTSENEVMRIVNGMVGIGTTNPLVTLNVAGAGASIYLDSSTDINHTISMRNLPTNIFWHLNQLDSADLPPSGFLIQRENAALPSGNPDRLIDVLGFSYAGDTLVLKQLIKSCPTGWTDDGNFCYSDLQSGTTGQAADQNCAQTYGAHTCSVGEYFAIGNGSDVWTNSFCNTNQIVAVTVPTNTWGCASGSKAYRCCISKH